MRDILIRFGLVHLELRTDILSDIDIGYINREDFECRAVIQSFGEHQFADGIRVLEHQFVALSATDRANDSFAYTGQDRIFSCTTDELAYIRAHGDTGFGDKLDTVFSHCGYRRRVNHSWVNGHLDGFEHVTSGKVNRRSHLEGEVYSGFVGRYECMHHSLDMSTGKIVRLQSVALHLCQTRLMRLNHTIDDFCGRHFTDAHEEELDQTDMHAADDGIDPQHEGHIIEEDTEPYDNKGNKNNI